MNAISTDKRLTTEIATCSHVLHDGNIAASSRITQTLSIAPRCLCEVIATEPYSLVHCIMCPVAPTLVLSLCGAESVEEFASSGTKDSRAPQEHDALLDVRSGSAPGDSTPLPWLSPPGLLFLFHTAPRSPQTPRALRRQARAAGPTVRPRWARARRGGGSSRSPRPGPAPRPATSTPPADPLGWRCLPCAPSATRSPPRSPHCTMASRAVRTALAPRPPATSPASPP